MLSVMCALAMSALSVPAMAEQGVAPKFEQGYGVAEAVHGTSDKMASVAEAPRLQIAVEASSNGANLYVACGLPKTQTAMTGTQRVEVAFVIGSKRTGEATA
jgi:hypothetical protein